MDHLSTDEEKVYIAYIQKQQQRLQQGLPRLGLSNQVKFLSDLPAYQLPSHTEGDVQEKHSVSDIHTRSSAPGYPYDVIFIDDGEVGSFYAAADDGSEEDSILDALHIYNTKKLLDQDMIHLFEIVWAKDGLKAALLINQHVHAVFDFESFRGPCRTTFSPVNPASSFGEYAHEWSKESVECFA
jgi:hypothetical protein